jgi:hypothetical protein
VKQFNKKYNLIKEELSRGTFKRMDGMVDFKARKELQKNVRTLIKDLEEEWEYYYIEAYLISLLDIELNR